MQSNAIILKAQLLANGIAIDSSMLDNYHVMFLEKRRAYGIQDPDEYLDKRIPQELVIMPENCVCSINIHSQSPWKLHYSKIKDIYYIKNDSNIKSITFPSRPKFYDEYLHSDVTKRVNQVISLYGGHSLGAFLNRNCFFENNGVCHFCSLCNNHNESNDFEDLVQTDILIESFEIALREDYPFTQIMLNGGNLNDLDKNFQFYINNLKSVRKFLDSTKREKIDLHLITSPPRNLELIEELAGIDVKIAINMEIYDDSLFAKFCPGKNKYIGHHHIKMALEKCVAVLGRGRVYSIFVGGLEPLNSLKEGIKELSDIGVIPVINVLHVDPNTLINEQMRPTAEYIIEAGQYLQKIYKKFPVEFVPFYEDCGRNSLDTEAYRNQF